MKKILILVRHGQSVYNLENRFTGWKNVDLTPKGENEAIYAGEILNKNGILPNIAFTSELKRAQDTLSIILNKMNISIPIKKNIALNERDYGSLIGQNKSEAAKKFGIEQVQKWRRSYDDPPPGGESLKMTCERVLPYLNNNIMSAFKEHSTILIAAHGNSIRAIVMKLLKFTSKDILKTEIGWCEPWIFSFNSDNIVDDFYILNSNRITNSSLPFIPNFNKNKTL